MKFRIKTLWISFLLPAFGAFGAETKAENIATPVRAGSKKISKAGPDKKGNGSSKSFTKSTASAVHSRFNSDYKTRSVSASSLPSQISGHGLGGNDIPIGSEDAHRKNLPQDFMPTDLVKLPMEFSYYGNAVYLRCDAADSLVRMFSDAASEGLRLQIFSGYRDYNHQERLYKEAVKRSGPNQKTVAKPGRSEHFLGTTADVTSGKDHLMKRSFGDTPEGKWLAKNAERYGWKMTVMPGNGKRSHGDEPWHIRYFGTGEPSGSQVAHAHRHNHRNLAQKVIGAPVSLVRKIGNSVSALTKGAASQSHRH